MLMDKLENRSSAVQLDPDDVHRAIADGALLIDGRTPEAYDACHVPGSVNVPVAGGELPSRALAAVGREPRSIAVAGTDVGSLTWPSCSNRPGIAGVGGILAGGVDAYRAAGYAVGRRHAVAAERVVDDLALGGAVLVDARDDEDWVRGTFPARCTSRSGQSPRLRRFFPRRRLRRLHRWAPGGDRRQHAAPLRPRQHLAGDRRRAAGTS